MSPKNDSPGIFNPFTGPPPPKSNRPVEKGAEEPLLDESVTLRLDGDRYCLVIRRATLDMLRLRLGKLFESIPAEKINFLRESYGITYDKEPRETNNYILPIEGGYLSFSNEREVTDATTYFGHLARGLLSAGLNELLNKHDMHVVVRGS